MCDDRRNSRDENLESNRELTVPYIVYESAMGRAERQAKRLVIALIMTIVLLFMSNGLWLYHWMQFDYITETESTVYSQDGEGLNMIGEFNGADINNNSPQENP